MAELELGNLLAAIAIWAGVLATCARWGWKWLKKRAYGEVTLPTLKKQIEDLHLIADKRHTDYKLQFDRMNKSLDNQNKIANRCSRRIGGVDSKLKGIDKRLYNVEEYLGNGFHKEKKDGSRTSGNCTSEASGEKQSKKR